MNTPQIVMLILVALDLMLSAHMHGRPRVKENGEPQTYSVWTAIVAAMINIFVLIWGGFFE